MVMAMEWCLCSGDGGCGYGDGCSCDGGGGSGVYVGRGGGGGDGDDNGGVYVCRGGGGDDCDGGGGGVDDDVRGSDGRSTYHLARLFDSGEAKTQKYGIAFFIPSREFMKKDIQNGVQTAVSFALHRQCHTEIEEKQYSTETSIPPSIFYLSDLSATNHHPPPARRPA
ncbi:hypothetical protein PoB_006670600 [Plakobranchus ocellatus]|uniref:Uncharacterized protein n=1 Tax=Plakobranchus ocellatus TaxID=259542 RepID=A0AAV4D8D5_9GAST|nr:hypothetical protein PoB_006670600 [Plakobranchus ocellatus]